MKYVHLKMFMNLVSRVSLQTLELMLVMLLSNFEQTKTLYQNNLNNIAVFFTFSKDYRYN